jgi:hypothetical protein
MKTLKTFDLLGNLAASLAVWRYDRAHPDAWARRDYGAGLTAGYCWALTIHLREALRHCGRPTRLAIGDVIRGTLAGCRASAKTKSA